MRECALDCVLNAKKEPAMGRPRRRGERHKGPETGEILVSYQNKRKVKYLQHPEKGGNSKRCSWRGGERPLRVGICEPACSACVDFKLLVKI